MARKIKMKSEDILEKEFIDKFNSLCKTRSSWQVWSDFITVAAISLANTVEEDTEIRNKREQEFATCIENLGGIDVPAALLGIITMAFEENPEQDFLGSIFMKLGLGNHWKGQFFTPYSVCKMISEINAPDLEATIKSKGWVAVNDPSCGAGATLIAMANKMNNHEIIYQNHVLFTAQDIDRVAGMMCYIQLSLLCCAGYVVITDTLSDPLISKSVLQPKPNNNQEIWYTPMYMSDLWHYRRLFNRMDSFLKET